MMMTRKCVLGLLSRMMLLKKMMVMMWIAAMLSLQFVDRMMGSRMMVRQLMMVTRKYIVAMHLSGNVLSDIQTCG